MLSPSCTSANGQRADSRCAGARRRRASSRAASRPTASDQSGEHEECPEMSRHCKGWGERRVTNNGARSRFARDTACVSRLPSRPDVPDPVILLFRDEHQPQIRPICRYPRSSGAGATPSRSMPANSGLAFSPSSTGATYSSSSSTSPAQQGAAASVAPASTCTSLMPRVASSDSSASRSKRRRARAADGERPARRRRRPAPRRRLQVQRGRGALAHAARRRPAGGRVRPPPRAAAARSRCPRAGARSGADRRPARCRCR